MITPLTHRQILQTAALETGRQAMEGAAQVQREQARRHAFDAKLAEALTEVPDIAESDALRLSERGEKHGGQGGDATGASPDGWEDADESPAEGAALHLDLLA
ncbi:hypothetical protein [Geothrix sp. 21YS21S-4]|uniref:hypothetical protein n=1 Tax=Geothrix sp. 21YS21S-4 TaxID=3068889 RepID=UPI0027BAE9C1|nr:hypothetical protein [Geothrix sp. 21YS21S-4]